MAIPSSTYRIQLTDSFPLDDATQVVSYLVDLGVGALYLSPVLASTPHSGHGYDTTDPTTIDLGRGGEEGWAHLVQVAKASGIGIVLDIVPNHLGVEHPADNPAWWSLLAHGAASPYAPWFDVDWASGPIVVPVLADAEPQLRLVDGPTGRELHYVTAHWTHRYPVAPGSEDGAHGLDEVMARQHYRLTAADRANEQLNYRRFFAVPSLAGVRVQDGGVFTATHARIARAARAGQLTGLRIDHPDGLADPGAYCARARTLIGDGWLIVEKILEPGEQLPAWDVDGTTGYDAMALVDSVFVDTTAEQRLTSLYADITGDAADFAEHVRVGKREAAEELFGAEIGRITRLIEAAGTTTDDTPAALIEISAQVPVYRAYLPQDTAILTAALDAAAAARPDLAATIHALAPVLGDESLEVATRFQQLTGAVMAKGVEDRAYYRYARFVALNEVGGDPARFGLSVADFHAEQADRQRSLPRSMTALSTHDTKRSEDVRARLTVLADGDWPDFADFARKFVASAGLPDRSLAYLLAQTLAAVGPIDRGRLHTYAEKAAREATTGTSWTAPDAAFEATMHAAIDRCYDDPSARAAWDRMASSLEAPGLSTALGRKLVQLMLPGVPDVYQGTEVFDDSLVDPDNRRPVDFARLRALATTSTPPPLDRNGAAKLHVTRQALRLRRGRPELFTGYEAVTATGPRARHLLGFDRGGAIALATLYPATLKAAGGWDSTVAVLPEGEWTDLLTCAHVESTRLSDVLALYPVALLVRA